MTARGRALAREQPRSAAVTKGRQMGTAVFQPARCVEAASRDATRPRSSRNERANRRKSARIVVPPTLVEVGKLARSGSPQRLARQMGCIQGPFSPDEPARGPDAHVCFAGGYGGMSTWRGESACRAAFSGGNSSNGAAIRSSRGETV